VLDDQVKQFIQKIHLVPICVGIRFPEAGGRSTTAFSVAGCSDKDLSRGETRQQGHDKGMRVETRENRCTGLPGVAG